MSERRYTVTEVLNLLDNAFPWVNPDDDPDPFEYIKIVRSRVDGARRALSTLTTEPSADVVAAIEELECIKEDILRMEGDDWEGFKKIESVIDRPQEWR